VTEPQHAELTPECKIGCLNTILVLLGDILKWILGSWNQKNSPDQFSGYSKVAAYRWSAP
jgi:hypothetical protein